MCELTEHLGQHYGKHRQHHDQPTHQNQRIHQKPHDQLPHICEHQSQPKQAMDGVDQSQTQFAVKINEQSKIV